MAEEIACKRHPHAPISKHSENCKIQNTSDIVHYSCFSPLATSASLRVNGEVDYDSFMRCLMALSY
jgi:hypothetical protein